MRVGIDLNWLRVLLVMLRMQVQMSNLLVMLITIVLLLMIVHEHIHELPMWVVMLTVAVDPARNFIIRVCYTFNEVLNIVLALLLEVMPNAHIVELLL